VRKKPAKKARYRIRSTLFQLPAMLGFFSKMRVFFHKLRGVNIGEDVEIGYYVLIDNLYPENVIIEDGVTISARSTVLAHDESAFYTGAGEEKVGNTRICENAFIGVHSVILSGVTIGRNAIVGAGSVVTSDVPDNAKVAGVPARTLRKNYFPRSKTVYRVSQIRTDLN
jgi:acetyltransferase-like isoleucine patch superfamily enzyme